MSSGVATNTPPGSASSRTGGSGDRCYIGVPMWAWKGFILPLAVAAVLGSFAWLGTMQAASSRHDTAIESHSQELRAQAAAIADLRASSEKRFDRVDSKLDWLIEAGKK